MMVVDRLHEKLREWGIAILLAIVIFAAVAAPAVVITNETRHAREQLTAIEEVLGDHDQQLVEQAERTAKGVRALTDGISCILLIAPEERSPQVVNNCITDALDRHGLR